MKIAFCLHHFLPTHIAGTEMYVFSLAANLQAMGVEALVIIPNLGSDSTEEYQQEGIRVIKYAENSLEDRTMILGKTKPDGLKLFVEIVKSEQPDVVHFHELAPGRGTNIFHVQAVHDLHIPVVLTFHLSGYSCIRGSLVYKDEKKCDGIIKISRCTDCAYQSKNITGLKAQVLGKTALAFFKLGFNTTKLDSTTGTALGFPFVINKIKSDLLKLSLLASKIVVLAQWYKTVLQSNGVPGEKIIYIPQGLTGSKQTTLAYRAIRLPLKLVFIGRISVLKGLHLLIDAMLNLAEEKVSLHIYGQDIGDDYALHCKQKSVSKNNIHWMGVIAAEDVIATLTNYHVLCLPSTFSEMSPLVIQEAFAAGLPVLASDVCGNAAQIKNGINGWLFRFKDALDLHAKIKMLTDDLSLIEGAKQHLPSPFLFRQVAAGQLKVYEGVLNTNNLVA